MRFCGWIDVEVIKLLLQLLLLLFKCLNAQLPETSHTSYSKYHTACVWAALQSRFIKVLLPVVEKIDIFTASAMDLHSEWLLNIHSEWWDEGGWGGAHPCLFVPSDWQQMLTFRNDVWDRITFSCYQTSIQEYKALPVVCVVDVLLNKRL